VADSFTPTLNLRKPEVSAANNTWGGTAGLNSDLDIIDAIFLATGLGTAVGLHVGPAQVLNVEGGITLKDPTDTTKIAVLDRSLITTATTRTYKFPDASGVLALQQMACPTGTILSGYYGAAAPPGFVLAAGKTIGNAGSLATERANIDCLTLFTLLWSITANAQCPVSGGRGASAAADWAANKTLTLPDHRGRVAAGLDNLGGTAAGRLTLGGGGTVRGFGLAAEKSSIMDQPTTLTGSLQGGPDTTAAGNNHTHGNVWVVQPTITVDVVIAL
jgi:hypothetical protein